MKLILKPGKIFGCLFLLVSFNTGYCSVRKHVIGAWAGGFGNVFLGALHHLAWCDDNGYAPVFYWDSAFPYYQPGGYNGSQNAWEYYFEPASNERYVPGDYIDRRFTPDKFRLGTAERVIRASREEGKRLIDKYVKVVAPIQKKIDDFYNENMQGKTTIGIHLRGTDIYIETKPTNPAIIFEEANKQANVLGDCQFLVATDEYRLLELAQKELNRKVVYYDCRRSTDGRLLVYEGNPDNPSDRRWAHDAKQAEDFLIEFILLSKCLSFIHSRSNASALPFYFNPDLQGIYFDPEGKITYF
jgi:hypothetical protein